MEKKFDYVDRDTYVRVVRSHPEWTENPIEAITLSVMQHVNEDGVCMAQAVYRKGGHITYSIRKED